jgi:hypothetical protein
MNASFIVENAFLKIGVAQPNPATSEGIMDFSYE